MTRRAVMAAVAVAVLVVACSGGDDSGAEEPTGSEAAGDVEDTVSVGPDGGSITSEDGMFTVEVPAGALASDMDLGITIQSAAEAGVDGSLLAGPVYELIPDGLVFDAPVTTTRSLSAAELQIDDNAIPFFHVFQGSGDDWSPLSTETSRSGDTIQVRATTTHFSSNVAVATTDVWGYGLELTMELEPGSFEAPVGSSVEVDISFGRPGDLVLKALETEPSHTGALASFILEEGIFGKAECGEAPGSGTYTVEADGAIGQFDFDDAETLPDEVLLLLFGVSPHPEPFTIAVTGAATCTEASSDDTDQAGGSGDVSAADVLRGSFGGAIDWESLLDGTTFESPYLLSVLPAESAAAVLTEPAQLIIDQIVAIVRAAVGEPMTGTNIILSQGGGEDAIAQNTFGTGADLGGGTVRVFTASTEETYSEFYIVDLTFCQGFPNACQDVAVEAVTVGGDPGLSVEQAFEDMLPYIERRERLGLDEGVYGWVYEGTGTLTREGGTPSG